MKCQALYSLKLKKGITKFVICYYVVLQIIIFTLAYDVASGSEITPCNKIDKSLVVYSFRETI